MYDDFDDPEYDGRLNPLLWGGRNIGVDAFQINGSLKLTASQATEAQDYSYFVDFLGLSQDTFTSIQVDMRISSSTNRHSGVGLSFLSEDIPGGWAEIGLGRYSNGWWNLGAQAAEALGLESRSIEPDTWYTLRVEFDRGTFRFLWMVNGL